MGKAKTVVVMADTHARSLSELPEKLLTAIRQADYVVHLGDFTSMELFNELRQMGNFWGITGNHDDPVLQKELNRMEAIEIDGKKIGLIHGLIVPLGSRLRMRRWFKQNKHDVHAILYGHTHLHTVDTVKGTFYFNPGSVAGKFPATSKSFGILTIDGTINHQIVILDSRGANGPWMYLPSLIMRGILRLVEAWP